jgi:uncharacterized damage-inducible protein DinB
MITRIWHGRTKKEDADSYRQYVIETGVRDYLKLTGNLGVTLWQREEGNETHIWMVTQWQNLECIKNFAGNDLEIPKYYPGNERFLLERERNVLHCQTFSFSNVRIQSYIRQLKQLFDGGSWNDESFLVKLNVIDEEKAFRQPGTGRHCIAEILWHCIYWRTVLIERIQGDNDFREKTYGTQNFLPLYSLQQKGWKKLLADFKQSQELLIGLLNTRDDNFLETKFQDGTNFDYLVEGVIHHDIYHLGQIGFVISILNQIANKTKENLFTLGLM